MRFEFIFQGNQEQFDFFRKVVSVKIDKADLKLDFIDEDGFNCSIVNDGNKIFKTGMLLAACYSKFEHLKFTIFN